MSDGYKHGGERPDRQHPRVAIDAFVRIVGGEKEYVFRTREGHGIVDQEMLGFNEQADELLLMGLRMKEGIDLVRWQQLSGREPDPKREQLLLEHGFIERLGNSRLRCTPAGMLILDSVVADLAC